MRTPPARFAAAALDFARSAAPSAVLTMRHGGVVPVALEVVAGRTFALTPQDPVVRTARAVGISLCTGD